MSCADYVFTQEKMNKQSGSYETLGVTTEESEVADFLHKFSSLNVLRIGVFTLGKLEGQ